MEHHEAKPKDSFSVQAAIITGSVLISVSILLSGGATLKQPSGNNTGGTAPVVTGKDTKERLLSLAEGLKLSKKEFEKCYDSGSFADKINSQTIEGSTAGVTGTPASFVIDAKGNTLMISGAQPFEAVKTAIDQALAGTLPKNDKPIVLRPVDNTDYVRGNKNAKITLIEYSDLECPFCARFHPTVQQVLQTYPNDVRFVYRHFPLSSIHPNAFGYAQAVECAGSLSGENAFFGMIDGIFANIGSWTN